MQPLNIVTIVAKNYLAQARVLARSFKEQNPEGKVFVLFVDAIEDYFDPKEEDFITLKLEELRDQIDHFESFCFQYTILELCTAVKPYVLSYLFKKYSFAKLAYFDPDILITASLQPIAELLENYNIILTPHLMQPYQDEKTPTEIDILQAGSYNLGFIALANTSVTQSMLEWWQKRLYKHCVVDIANGLFVDQKWTDLIPGLFAETYILRDPGYNVAYWNLHERAISVKNQKFSCNKVLLRFFHFSGYDPSNATIISRHQNRYSMSEISAAATLFALYAKLLQLNGYEQCKKWPYAFAFFENGVEIPALVRRFYLNTPSLREKFSQPFKTERISAAQSFFDALIKVKKGQIPLLAQAIYQNRSDLQIDFPDIYNKDKVRFLKWLSQEGYLQLKLDRLWLSDIRAYLQQVSQISENSYGGLAFGVNVLGYHNSEKGVGEAVRSNVRCLDYTTIPFVLNNILDVGSTNLEVSATEFFDENFYSINLIHVNADELPSVVEHKGKKYFQNRYNIGCWEWELTEFPLKLQKSFQNVDEIWVASNFIKDAVSLVSPKPVIRVPHSIEVLDIKEPAYDREFFGISKDHFVFFFMFDFQSYIARKNPYGVITAFLKAFEKNSRVTLVIKSSRGEFFPDEWKKLVEMCQNNSIILIDKVLPKEQVRALMYHADCYVSLHRCEGFGLTIGEAMSFAKPVIMTAYSGNTDFMTLENCYPVKYKLVTIDRDYGPYKKGWTWAEPDLDQAASWMRYVYEHPTEAKAVGKLAREYIIEHFSPQAVSKIYQIRLGSIAGRQKMPVAQQVLLENAEEKLDALADITQVLKMENGINDLDIRNIPVTVVRKPYLAFFIKFYKRVMRKSMFWLLHPLFTQLRHTLTTLLQVQKELCELQKKLILEQEELKSRILVGQAKSSSAKLVKNNTSY